MGRGRKLCLLVFLLGFIFVSWPGTMAAPPDDATPPIISITNPREYDCIKGILNVTVTALDNQTGVKLVGFYVESTNVRMEDTTAPYSFSWDSRLHADGIYKITCYACDRGPYGGNTAFQSIRVVVGNNSQPKMFITSYYGSDKGKYGIDHRDIGIMSNGLKSLGFTLFEADTNVCSWSMIKYLRGNGVTLYYHAGHGDPGIVYTAEAGGSIKYDSTMIYAQNTIFATCLTLIKTEWTCHLGASAKSLMGYLATVPGTLNDVANRMISELGKGRSFVKSWYLSNVANSYLRDRWCAYVREGSGIVEYSPRTGRIPQAVAPSALLSVGESGQVFMAPELLSQNMIGANVPMNVLQAIPEEIVTETENEEFGQFKPTTMSAGEAIQRAEMWLRSRGMRPEDAAVDQVIPLQRQIDTNSPAVIIGYQVSYRRELNGVKIVGNGIEDHIVVLVGSSKVMSASRYWPNLLVTEMTWQPSRLLRIDFVIWMAADEIAKVFKDHPFRIVRAELVYGTPGPMGLSRDIVPAYAVYSDDGLRLIIDAKTGRLLY